MNIDRFAIHQGTMKHIATDEFLLKGAESGFKNFSLWLPSLVDSIDAGISIEKINKIIHDFELKIIEISPLHSWAFMSDSDRHDILSEINKICDLAQKLNAECICAPVLGKGDYKHVLENLIILADIAQAYKLKVAVEFVPQQQIDNLMTSWQLVRESSRENVGILLDTVLFSLGSSALADLDAVPIEKIFLVHLSNLSSAVDAASDFIMMVRNFRTFPDSGKFDLNSLLHKLECNKYRGYYSLEVLNSEHKNLRAETIFQQAKNAIQDIEIEIR